MTSPQQIADRLEELLLEKFPGEPVYRELVPTDFSRPSNLIVQNVCKGNVGYGCTVVELRPKFTINTYVPVDEYHHSHLETLHHRQMAIVGLLILGYIKVGDRAVKVSEVLLDGGYDYDTVTVTFTVTIDRNEFIETPQQAPIAQLHINKEVM